MSHTMKSLLGGSNTWIHVRAFEGFLFLSPACTWLYVRSQTVSSLHGISGTLHATPSWSFSIVLEGCSSPHLLFTIRFPQGDLGSVLPQALHGSEETVLVFATEPFGFTLPFPAEDGVGHGLGWVTVTGSFLPPLCLGEALSILTGKGGVSALQIPAICFSHSSKGWF